MKTRVLVTITAPLVLLPAGAGRKNVLAFSPKMMAARRLYTSAKARAVGSKGGGGRSGSKVVVEFVEALMR